MGTQQRKIFLVFQSRFSIHRITNCMGKHASLRIASGLCSVCGYFCCGKYFAVCRYNIPTDHMIRKQILQGIIRTVDKRFTLTYLKIDKINHHRQKHCQEQIHNNKKFFITFLCLFLFSSHLADSDSAEGSDSVFPRQEAPYAWESKPGFHKASHQHNVEVSPGSARSQPE